MNMKIENVIMKSFLSICTYYKKDFTNMYESYNKTKKKPIKLTHFFDTLQHRKYRKNRQNRK
jgi:hypothetical protein